MDEPVLCQNMWRVSNPGGGQDLEKHRRGEALKSSHHFLWIMDLCVFALLLISSLAEGKGEHSWFYYFRKTKHRRGYRTLYSLHWCLKAWCDFCSVFAVITVKCLSTAECVLPCQFESDGMGARIMWYKMRAVVSCTRYGNTSFISGHNSPADKYKGRTDLYTDQVLEGNATLLLRNVTPNDQGKYFCITMTAPRVEESGIITLVVEGKLL